MHSKFRSTAEWMRMVPAPEMFLSLHRGTANSCIIRFFFVLTEIHGHSEQDPALGDVWKYWEVPSVGLGIDPCFSQTPALTAVSQEHFHLLEMIHCIPKLPRKGAHPDSSHWAGQYLMGPAGVGSPGRQGEGCETSHTGQRQHSSSHRKICSLCREANSAP